MEKPTTDEAGSKGSEVEVAPASRDADEFGTGGVNAATGASIRTGAAMGAVDKI